jgi:hypothetical protein
MTSTPPSLPPLIKTVTVKASQAQAFKRFTSELATWWPLSSHSIGQDQTETVTMEGRVGGRIVERIRDGRECVWGTVTTWTPPAVVAFTWHPGEEPARAGLVELRFTPMGEVTQVQLTHSGFERLGKIGPRARRAYGMGWGYVLGLYTGRRGLMMFSVAALTRVANAIRRWRIRKRPAA